MSKTIPTYSSCHTIQKKYSLTYLRRIIFVVIEEKVKGQTFPIRRGGTCVKMNLWALARQTDVSVRNGKQLSDYRLAGDSRFDRLLHAQARCLRQ